MPQPSHTPFQSLKNDQKRELPPISLTKSSRTHKTSTTASQVLNVKLIERLLLTKAYFTGSVQLLFNLRHSFKMSTTSRIWSSLLLCMFAFVVLKSQHGKKNIVILTHLVGNIKSLICHVRASPTEVRGALKSVYSTEIASFCGPRSAGSSERCKKLRARRSSRRAIFFSFLL